MLKTQSLKTDLCVIGGGIAGICTAVAAARKGINVVLMHERPMLGGNASSEIRMWISGAVRRGANETGLIEEIELENLYRNPTKNWYLWDHLLFDFVKREKNITLLLNCTCMDASTTEGQYPYGRTKKITSVKGYQLTTQSFIEIESKFFADCSGDSILAPLTGAEFMIGREGKKEFGEATVVEKHDSMTMGMSCLIQGRETTKPVKFTLPEGCKKFGDEHYKYRKPEMHEEHENFWYLELGGNRDSIADTESIRDELIELALGTWDYIKNSGNYNCDNYELEFLGFLPGKRESRRMTGEYIITANDVLSDFQFDDTIAFGGWPIDDHFPDGFYYDGTPNTDFHTPAPYCIPYRCTYSKNVDNLFFAGRNISMTHMAMSSIRVMKTIGLIGQAVGTAAALAVKNDLTPHGVYLEKLCELQQQVMADDSFLPNKRRTISDSCKNASLSGADDTVRDGIDRVSRVYNNTSCGTTVRNGQKVEYTLSAPTEINNIHIVFDSDIERVTLPGGWCERTHATRANVWLDSPTFTPPAPLCKNYSLYVTDENGCEKLLLSDEKNIRRAINAKPESKVTKVTLVMNENWGSTDSTNLFSFDFN